MVSDTTLGKEVNQYLYYYVAMKSANTAVLSAMIDEAFVLRHLSDATQSRSKWLADVQHGTMRYHHVEKHDVHIRQEEDGCIKVKVHFHHHSHNSGKSRHMDAPSHLAACQ